MARQNEFVQSGNLEALAGYYARADSWAGVETFLAELGLTAGRGRNRPALLLADAQVQVVFDERGQRAGSALTNDEFTRAVPVVSQGATVGYVVFNAAEGGAFTPAQQAFLNQLQLSLIVAAVAAGLLGIGLGVIVSRSLAAPLGQVAAAARGFARREWDQRAPVTGADEVADVGRAFNAMAVSLQKAETLRHSLMADIAHELRTPLTVMQGNLRAILDGVYPLEMGEIVTLYDETRFLSRLVDDLRELALADAGQLSLQIQPLDTADLVRRLQTQFAAGADAAEVLIQAHIPAVLPRAHGDADRTAQVLRNLIANAIRHTPAGGQVTVAAEPAPAGGVRFSVRDTGAGIPAADQPHVFERFYRGDNARAGSGLGLGLAIAKAWVEAMGGQIGLESELGQGSCFWFTLPAAT